ncbi:MAG: DUF1801 domain-containing protein [Phycisphaerales bacterium]|nr:DUF1801 domain-containing protein [Phycisphaerales bacterium]
MQSKATTVAQYLAELPEDRREAIGAVRKVILKNLGKGYTEGMQYGMIGYAVPHAIYPAGYHCDPSQPLPFASLASQKNHMALYLMCVYGDEADRKRFEGAWAKTGKKLDMGKSCIRFKRVEDLALDVIGEAIRRVPVETYLERYEKMLSGSGKASAGSSGRAERPAKRAAKRGPTDGSPRPAPKGGPESVSARAGTKAAKKTAKKSVTKATKKATRKAGGSATGARRRGSKA